MICVFNWTFATKYLLSHLLKETIENTYSLSLKEILTFCNHILYH
jgi:hypothetical protein